MLFSIKAPTGETHDKDDNGERFEAGFKAATGSWDYWLGAAVSHSSGTMGYYANFLYNKTTEGLRHTEIGGALLIMLP